MLSNKEIIVPNNLLNAALKNKGVKEIMYPGQNKDTMFRMNVKKEIKLSKIIKKDLVDLKK